MPKPVALPLTLPSFPRLGGGLGSAIVRVSGWKGWKIFCFEVGVGEVIILSWSLCILGGLDGIFKFLSPNGLGEERSGEEESGDETVGENW